MGYRTCILAVALALTAGTLPSAGTAGQSPSREQMMCASVVLKYQGMKTLAQTVTGALLVDVGCDSTKASFTSSVQLAQPNRFRIETTVKFLDKETKGGLASDGKSVWMWDADKNQYSQQPWSAFGENADKVSDWLFDHAGPDVVNTLFLQAAGGQNLGLPRGADKLLEVKDYPTTEIDGRPMYVVPIQMGKARGKAKEKAALYVDANDLLVRRWRVVTAKQEQEGLTRVNMVFFYSQIKTNAELPVETFTFTPPAGAKKVARVQPAVDRAFGE